MSTSSRSSSEAASSLRLVKMSVTPRAIVVDERDRPARRRWSQLCFGAGAAGATVRGRWGFGERRLDNQLGFIRRRRVGGCGRLAAAEPAAQQT